MNPNPLVLLHLVAMRQNHSGWKYQRVNCRPWHPEVMMVKRQITCPLRNPRSHAAHSAAKRLGCSVSIANAISCFVPHIGIRTCTNVILITRPAGEISYDGTIKKLRPTESQIVFNYGRLPSCDNNLGPDFTLISFYVWVDTITHTPPSFTSPRAFDVTPPIHTSVYHCTHTQTGLMFNYIFSCFSSNFSTCKFQFLR